MRVCPAGEGFDDYLDKNPNFVRKIRNLHDVVDANPAALSLFGVDSLADLNAKATRLLPADPDGRFVRAIARGSRACFGERSIVRPDGSRIPIIWCATLPTNPDNFNRIYFHAIDITAQRHAEEELDAARANLNRAARLSLAGELSASLAHEVAQPLSSIATLSHVALNMINGKDHTQDSIQVMVERIAKSARHASGIVSRIKSFARHSEQDATTVEPHELFREAVALADFEISRQLTILDLHVDTELPAVRADTTQIQQVIVNIIVNSLQAMTSITPSTRKITISATEVPGGFICFSLSDTGPGISDENHSKLFEPFFSAKKEGVGLGLSISRRIIEEHGGRIWASNLQQGLSVCFTLPIATDDGSTSAGVPSR